MLDSMVGGATDYLAIPVCIAAMYGLVWSVSALSHGGEEGRRRLRATEDLGLQQTRELYRTPFIPSQAVAGGVLALLIGVACLARAELVAAGLCAGAIALHALTVWSWRRARRVVMAVAEEHDLPPLTYQASVRRARRQRQVGTLTVGLFCGGTALLLLPEAVHQQWLAVVGGVGMVLALVSGSAYAWTAGWIFGDEEERPVP